MSDIFNEIDPTLYDLSISCVVPHLRMHQGVRARVFADVSKSFQKPTLGADLGIGTGGDARKLLPQGYVGKLYGIDRSENMSADIRQKNNLPGPKRANLNLISINADIGLKRSDGLALLRKSEPHGLDFVSSAFAIHNLEPSGQRVAFSHVYQLLRAGGYFLYLDLFTFEEAEVANSASSFDEAHILRSFRRTPRNVSHTDWKRLGERWIHHYRHENHLVPIDSTSGESATSMIRAAGFRSIEIVSRCMQAAFLLCRR